MRILAFLVLLAATPAAASPPDSDRAGVAERLAVTAQKALDAVLGAGRSQVHVEIEGDHSEINSETEFLTPIDKTSSAGQAATRLLDLPGYAKDRLPEPVMEKNKTETPGQSFYQREREQSHRDAGFLIRSIQVSVILDTALDDGAVRSVSQLLPQVLKIDTTRGDTLSILRAPLRPAWKSAFSTPSDWRSAAYALGGAVAFLLAAAIAGFGLVRAGRALGRELASRAAARPDVTPPPIEVEPLPELAPGSGGLLEAGAGSAAATGTPQLGRRFDFLIGRDPDLILRALATETPSELSLFFGHLAESIPELASRLFTLLPAGRQSAASSELIKLSLADPERLGAIEERLRQAMENGVLGPASLGKLLSRVSGDARANVLDSLAAQDANAAREVQSHMFSFEDLTTMGPLGIRRLLAAVPYDIWGPALRGAPQELVDLVLAELPEGPRTAVREAFANPLLREKVEMARARILDAFNVLEAKGAFADVRAGAEGGLV